MIITLPVCPWRILQQTRSVGPKLTGFLPCALACPATAADHNNFNQIHFQNYTFFYIFLSKRKEKKENWNNNYYLYQVKEGVSASIVLPKNSLSQSPPRGVPLAPKQTLLSSISQVKKKKKKWTKKHCPSNYIIFLFLSPSRNSDHESWFEKEIFKRFNDLRERGRIEKVEYFV